MMAVQLSFLTDENIDQEVVKFLRDQGFDVLDIKEQGLFRLSDRSILELAEKQSRVVISQDSDFGTLIFRDKMDVRGVIYLRPGHESPEVHLQTMEAILSANLDLTSPFMLVGENLSGFVKIRLRFL
jgi:predicted nuclease of predicted toxin-antitoxin system